MLLVKLTGPVFDLGYLGQFDVVHSFRSYDVDVVSATKMAARAIASIAFLQASSPGDPEPKSFSPNGPAISASSIAMPTCLNLSSLVIRCSIDGVQSSGTASTSVTSIGTGAPRW